MAPLSAVTKTVKVLFPGITDEPLIVRLAPDDAAVATATTLTAVVPGGNSTVDPFTTPVPFTVKVLKLVSSDGTCTTKLLFAIVVASPAVTFTVTVLSPTCNPVAPVTRTVADDEVGVPTTVTVVVPAGTFLTVLAVIAPETRVIDCPFIVTELSFVSLLKTFALKVVALVWSFALSFSVTTKILSPVIKGIGVVGL